MVHAWLRTCLTFKRNKNFPEFCGVPKYTSKSRIKKTRLREVSGYICWGPHAGRQNGNRWAVLCDAAAIVEANQWIEVNDCWILQIKAHDETRLHWFVRAVTCLARATFIWGYCCSLPRSTLKWGFFRIGRIRTRSGCAQCFSSRVFEDRCGRFSPREWWYRYLNWMSGVKNSIQPQIYVLIFILSLSFDKSQWYPEMIWQIMTASTASTARYLRWACIAALPVFFQEHSQAYILFWEEILKYSCHNMICL